MCSGGPSVVLGTLHAVTASQAGILAAKFLSWIRGKPCVKTKSLKTGFAEDSRACLLRGANAPRPCHHPPAVFTSFLRQSPPSSPLSHLDHILCIECIAMHQDLPNNNPNGKAALLTILLEEGEPSQSAYQNVFHNIILAPTLISQLIEENTAAVVTECLKSNAGRFAALVEQFHCLPEYQSKSARIKLRPMSTIAKEIASNFAEVLAHVLEVLPDAPDLAELAKGV